MREKTYYPNPCTIQVAYQNSDNFQKTFLIDVLSGIELDPLFKIMENRDITKILHSARQDIEVFYKLMGKMPVAIIDTQIMAAFCGFQSHVGYAKLLKELLDIEIDKNEQRSDWAARPLTKEQVEYALLDVVYLPEVYQILKAKLKKSGRDDWIDEKHRDLLDEENYNNFVEKSWQNFSFNRKSPNCINIIKELSKWRELEAQKADVPRGYIIKDQIIRAIAIRIPKSKQELSSILGIRGDFITRRGDEVIDIVKEAVKNPKGGVLTEGKQILTCKQELICDLLKILLKVKAEEYKISPEMIVGRNDLRDIAIGEQSVEGILSGWKYELFGVWAEKLISGEIGFKMENGETRLINTNSF